MRAAMAPVLACPWTWENTGSSVFHAFMNPRQRIALAIALFNERRFDQALAGIGDLLQGDEANVDALNLAAACARALGRPDDAEAFWRKALARDPAHAASWNNLGILLQQRGRGAEAGEAFRRALQLQPDYAEAHYNLALLYQQAGGLEQAVGAHEAALALRPRYPEASANLGLVLERLGRFEEAQRRFGEAVAHDPADAASLQHRADLLQRLGRRAEAAECYRAALLLRPDNAELHNNFAVLLARSGQPEAAEREYLQAVACRPGYADAWHNLGLSYTQSGRYAEAEAALRTCLRWRAHDPEVWNSLGNVYQYMQRDDDAEAAYRRALAARPGLAKTFNNLGTLRQRQGRAGEAEDAYRQAIAADPGYPEARWNLGFLLLAQGRLAEGWPWMEARHDPALARPIAVRPAPGFPQWNGEALDGKAIAVWPEQGFGDQIQFVRYLPWLKAAGARTVTLICHDALLPLLRGAAGADRVVPKSEAGRLAPHDFWVFMLSLPMHAGTTLATIPATLPYLAADPARRAYWRARLDTLPAGMRVGLVWRGFGGHVNDANRSLPDLSVLAPLWSVPGVAFVSLQRGMDGEPRRAGPDGLDLLELGAGIADFGDTAAIVAELDLVICVDTAVAHVAGALGKRCWVLLPAIHPDWRWMEERADSPWYPGVLRLYRQRHAGAWDELVARVAHDLAAIAY
ncbi:tetratricopeptide repeat protein [Massilia sp. NEAU-DD11]|uniref:Tetratricopeptide repeat protein n=2 Tax=Massilia TaxID=149698 RepID=A0A7X3G0P0_9BURK|nr:tetratricopeptide repeat protein [Telluria cellulosilytica]MVW61494.1 tetratricopeptide repeat protein [Telluria cellulosilytica]